MVNAEKELFKLLDIAKTDLLAGVSEKDRFDLLTGFLKTTSDWMKRELEISEEDFWLLYDAKKTQCIYGIKDMAVEEKMLYFQADDSLRKMWNINSYLDDLQDKHKFKGFFWSKDVLDISISLFNKCKDYSINHKTWALHQIMKHLKIISPISFGYIEYTFYKLKKQGKMPKNAKCYHF